jgi:diguanylate cyclase (GGDEF)-like protein/PAS domain S-box-containing protein
MASSLPSDHDDVAQSDTLGQRLREAEERYEQLIGATRDIIYTHDLNGNFTSLNHAGELLLGYSQEDAHTLNVRQVLTPECIEIADRMMHVKLAGVTPPPFEVEVSTKNGERIWLELSTHILRRDGIPVAVQGIARDVTERKRVEAALRDSEEQFHALSSAAQDAIIMMDNDGRVSFWSAAAERVFGYSRDEAIGSQVHDLLVPAAQRERFEEAFPHWRETGQGAAVGKTLELQAIRQDGTEVPIELSLSSVRLKGRWNAIAILRDIQDRKRAETEVRDANTKLRAVVQQLEKHNLLSGVVSEMREFLLACSGASEIGPVVVRSMRRLFPDSAGALFILSPSRTDLEAIARWGAFPADVDQNVFPPDACWGLRRGSPHFVADVDNDLVCPHLKHSYSAGYACLPLMAKGDILGVLHLGMPPETSPEGARKWIAELRELSPMLCEVLSLSVWNIRLRETLNNQAIKDPLTGLFNRRYMEEALQHEIYRAARTRNSIGILMADIDHFKDFNDLYGHASGDTVLIELAKFFKSRMRKTDVVCRYGGEEFILVLPDSPLQESMARADQLREEVKAMRVSHAGQLVGPVTLSIGVSTYPASGTDPNALLLAADSALYRAKHEGRDKVIALGG